MKHFCLSLFFAYLLAACPNNCSGHGSCNESGICTCNKQTGLALNSGAFNTFTYTGADCSHSIYYIYYFLGTCPFGTPFGTYKGVEKKEKEGYDGCSSAPCRRALGEMTVRFLDSKATEDKTTAEETTTAIFPSVEKDLTNSSYTTWNVSNPILPEEMGRAGGTLMCKSSKTGKTAGKADVLSIRNSTGVIYATIRFMFNLTETGESEEITTAETTTATTTTTTADDKQTAKVKRLRNLVDEDVEDATTEEEGSKTTPEPTTSAPTASPPTASPPTASPPPSPKEEGFNLQELECSVIKLREDLTTLVPETAKNDTRTVDQLPTNIPDGFPTNENKKYQVIVWEEMSDILSDMGLFDEKPTIPSPAVIRLLELVYTGKEVTLLCYDRVGGTKDKIQLKSFDAFLYADFHTREVVFLIKDQSKIPTNPETCRLAATSSGDKVNITDTEIGKNNGCKESQGEVKCDEIIVPDTNSEDTRIVETNNNGNYVLTATKGTIGTKAMSAMINAYSNIYNHYAFIPIPQSDDEYGNILMKLTEGAKLSFSVFNNGFPVDNSPVNVTVASVIGTSFNLPNDIIDGGNNVSPKPTGRILAETLESDVINLPTVYTSEAFHPLNSGGKKSFYDTISMKVEITESDSRTTMECSGQGICNRESGQCQCYPGYNGDACQRLSCPNDCSNHGRCVKVYEAIAQPTVIYYNGYGNKEHIYSCICDPGHRGSDCSLLECPSSTDPMKATNIAADGTDEYRDCSGRGNCDYSTGLCGCFDGFYGEACQYASTYA